MTGRPYNAFGVWPDMIRAAGSVEALAYALCLSYDRLRRVYHGFGSIGGARTVIARNFAAYHGIPIRCYVHPLVKGKYLVSAPSGWWAVPMVDGGWRNRAKCRRLPSEDWSGLDSLEVSFALVWDLIGPIGRDIPKSV